MVTIAASLSEQQLIREHHAARGPRLAGASAQEQAVSSDFDALFLANFEAVFRLAYRIAGTREEAEDLAQETFIRLHGSPRVWESASDASLRAWLYQVVTHLAYNSARGQGRRRRREDAVFGLPSGEADPAEMAEQAERRLAVRRALLKLPQRQAQLLLLRHAGLSYKELAEGLGLAPGSVGTLLARAEAAFEKAYAAEEN
jgi:RNA polymerase sigma-70 factor, ECF subfamily